MSSLLVLIFERVKVTDAEESYNSKKISVCIYIVEYLQSVNSYVYLELVTTPLSYYMLQSYGWRGHTLHHSRR